MDKRILNYAKKIQNALVDSGLFPNALSGACGIASKELFEFGVRNNLPVSFAYKRGDHCFNLVDGFIVDITAWQFNQQYENKVAVLDTADRYVKSCWWWKTTCIASTIEEYITAEKDYIQFEKWMHQNPALYAFTTTSHGKLMFTPRA